MRIRLIKVPLHHLKDKGNGLVVQLVRISACHAGGRGFESRPDRRKALKIESFFYSKQFQKSFDLTPLKPSGICYFKNNDSIKLDSIVNN